jgi:hypothetical protein
MTKIVLCAVLLFLMSDIVGCRGSKPEDKTIPMPELETVPPIELKIVKVAPQEGAITVETGSSSPVRLWRNSNSWGYTAWKILRVRGGQVAAFYQNPFQVITKNNPTFDTIGGDVRREETLHLNGGDWCSVGVCTPYFRQGVGGKTITFEPRDLLIVLYDIPITQEAQARAVWYGAMGASFTVK